MRVAVVIPCFNDGATVGEAVASVEESPEPVELVVVDDGSTDQSTVAVLDGLSERGVHVLRQANTGLPGARMAGLGATTAPYVFPLDADDLLVGETLPVLADRMDAEPDIAALFGDYAEFGGPEDLIRVVPDTLDPFRIAYHNEYPPSALFRRTALEQVGGWKPIAWGFEDWDLWMALAEAGLRGAHVGPGHLTHRRRLHGERMLTVAKRHYPELYRALKDRHERLFADIAGHRRRSDMSTRRKLLYPIVYGGRRRFAFEARIKAWLDRRRLWTLRR